MPLWMQNGPDRELHWEFNKKWNRWFTGEGEKWWTRYVPRKVRDRIDNEVKRQIRKMEAQLHQREDDLHAKLEKLDTDDQQAREE